MKRSVSVAALAAVGWVALPTAAATLAPRTGLGAIVLPLVVVTAFLAVGTLATRWRPDHRAAGWLLTVAVAHVCAFALTGLSVQFDAWWLALAAALLFLFGFVAVAGLLATFPDGTYRPGWALFGVRAAAVAGVALPLAHVLATGSVPVVLQADPLPETLTIPVRIPLLAPLGGLVGLLFLTPVLGVVAAIWRYRNSDADARTRMRWPLLSAVVAGFAVVLSLLGRLPTDLVAAIALCTLPITLVIGMLRHRLFDVDLAIIRALVVGFLWIVIAAAYLLAAAALGILTGDRSSPQVGIAVALVASLAFQPARQWLERKVDRWIRGPREAPFDLVARLTADLERLTDGDTVRRVAEEQVRKAVGAQWVTITDVGAEPVDAALTVPLTHGAVTVGVLALGPREVGDHRRLDPELLAAMAVPIALAIRTTHLTEHLAARVRELAASRRRIVQAGETERRRIERDLHDGIQQDLIALMAGLQMAQTSLAIDPRTASRKLDDLRHLVAETHRNLRLLVRGIYPAVLTDRGVVAAIEARLEDLPIGIHLLVERDVRDRRFPPEVEGAAYFLVAEGLTNVIRHADVSEATVRVGVCDGNLEIEVRDTGCGFRNGRKLGTGLRGLQDRLNALGGELTIGPAEPIGTTLRGRLPYQENRDG